MVAYQRSLSAFATSPLKAGSDNGARAFMPCSSSLAIYDLTLLVAEKSRYVGQDNSDGMFGLPGSYRTAPLISRANMSD